MKTTIESLIKQYPKLNWHQGELYKSSRHQNPIYNEEETRDLIASHYDGMESTIQGEDSNPENEKWEIVNGVAYVELMFGGDWEKAFKSI